MMTDTHTITRRTFVSRLGFTATLFIVPRPIRRRGMADTNAVRGLEHPEPRPGITAARVLADDSLKSSRKEVLTAYDFARTYPATFDGIACGCGCSEKTGAHRSLLVCYETQQPTGCWSCQKEAQLVGELAEKQTSLAEIRAAVDKKFG